MLEIPVCLSVHVSGYASVDILFYFLKKSGFKSGFDPFSHFSALYHPDAPFDVLYLHACLVLYLGPVLIGCGLVLAIRCSARFTSINRFAGAKAREMTELFIELFDVSASSVVVWRSSCSPAAAVASA